MKIDRIEYYRVFKEVLKDRLYDAYISNNTALQAVFESQIDLVNRRISEAQSGIVCDVVSCAK